MKLYSGIECTCGDVLGLTSPPRAGRAKEDGTLQGQEMYLFLKCVNEECEREFAAILPLNEFFEIGV